MASLSNSYRVQNWTQGNAFNGRQQPEISTSEPSLTDIMQLLQSAQSNSHSAFNLPPLDSFASHDGWGLLISVEGVDFDYQFTRDDLQKVFQRYGRLTAVDTLFPTFPFGRVWFRTRQDAESAILDLDNKILSGIHGRLRVVWDPASLHRSQTEQQTAPAAYPTASTSPTRRDGQHHAASVSPHAVRKYTCRFDIGIDNDKEFQVARRIIGQKGCNMKRIVDTSGAKLRLRGKGSGYLEGPTKQESPEPLHLCVSCTSQRGYSDAVKAVTEILENVYAEYKRFRKSRRGRGEEEFDIRVVMHETPLSGDGGRGHRDEIDYPSSPEHTELQSPQQAQEKRYDSGYWKVPS